MLFFQPSTSHTYPFSLHDALPISLTFDDAPTADGPLFSGDERTQRIVHTLKKHGVTERSEEHTSELQSPCNLVCRLLLEKKKLKIQNSTIASSLTYTLSIYYYISL